MKKTIGLNPLEEYLSFSQEIQKEEETLPAIPEVQPLQVKKQRVTIHVPAELIDRVKNAVYWEPGLTLAGFAEMALSKALVDLEQERGAPFPSRRDRQLRGGRPIK